MAKKADILKKVLGAASSTTGAVAGAAGTVAKKTGSKVVDTFNTANGGKVKTFAESKLGLSKKDKILSKLKGKPESVKYKKYIKAKPKVMEALVEKNYGPTKARQLKKLHKQQRNAKIKIGAGAALATGAVVQHKKNKRKKIEARRELIRQHYNF